MNNSSNEIDDQETLDNAVVDETIEQSSSSNTGLPIELPGSLLKAARQRAGLSLSEVAKELYMSVRKLEALERDDYRALPSAVFVQGYIKKYSSIVKENDGPLLAGYDHYLKTQRAINPGSMQVNLGVEKRKNYSFLSLKWMVPAGLLVVSISILVFVMAFTKQQRPELMATINESDQLPESPVSEMDRNALEDMESELNAIRDQNDAPIASVETALANHLAASESAVSEVARPQTQARPNQALNKLESASASNLAAINSDAPMSLNDSTLARNTNITDTAESLDELLFRISEDCWIEVSDTNGSRIYASLASAGQTVTLDGEAPFSIMLGNARAVELSINGESVLISTAPGRDTARLVVDR